MGHIGSIRLIRVTEAQNRNNRTNFGSLRPRTKPGTEYFGSGYFGFSSGSFGLVLGSRFFMSRVSCEFKKS